MILSDTLTMAFGNLWRMKLRSVLTVSGVVIGIAALVSMISFGAGMQKNVAQSFQAFELFTSLQILGQPERNEHHDEHDPDDQPNEKADTVQYRKLDDNALREIAAIPGVKSVYPEETFPVRVKFGEKSTNTTAQALPATVAELGGFKELLAGRFFQSDTAREVLINRSLMNRLGVEDPDSIVGQEITLISAKVNVGAAMTGLMFGRRVNPFTEVSYPFTVCGVREMVADMGGFTLRSLSIPLGAARHIERLNFSNPMDLLTQLSRSDSSLYSSFSVRMTSAKTYDAARDSIEALGYRTFSFADAFADIKKGFLIFDAVLGVVGFIALVVASLGIINTMVMSILERYREIGILKSLGADSRDVRRLILVESSVIGLLGSVFGILLGWVMTRIGSAIARYYMAKEGAPRMELFDLPWWLILLALIFGVSVSLLAGLYPSHRAMRVDPVVALRHE